MTMKAIEYVLSVVSKMQTENKLNPTSLDTLCDLKEKVVAFKQFRELIFNPIKDEFDARGYMISLSDMGLLYHFDDDVHDMIWDGSYVPDQRELTQMALRQDEVNELRGFDPHALMLELLIS